MIGILPAPKQYLFSKAENNNLTNNGLAIQGVAPDGNPMILRETLQYQYNSYGQLDGAYSVGCTIATLQAVLTRMASAITSKYPRVILIPDGTAVGPGVAAVSPSIIKGELVAEMVGLIYDGLCSGLADFKKNLIVEIDPDDPNRANVLYPPVLSGQLRVFAALAQFKLLAAPVAV